MILEWPEPEHSNGGRMEEQGHRALQDASDLNTENFESEQALNQMPTF